jgi:MFS transporter, ACS family, D-galactonate transporter
MNVSLLKSASFTILPWFIATIAQFVIAGWLVDRLVQRGHDETLVRKSTIIACLLGGWRSWALRSLGRCSGCCSG